MGTQRRYSIGELAELTGVSRRTIHFYVQRGLLQRPRGAGRGHYYTGEHAARLAAIKDLQANGHPLEGIARRLSGTGAAVRVAACEVARAGDDEPAASLWRRVAVADGVELHVESGAHRLTPAKIERLRRALREIFGETRDEKPHHDKGGDGR